jgi:hypothetical protein
VATVEPGVTAADQRPRAKLLQAGGPADLGHGAGKGFVGDVDHALVAKHGNGEHGIVGLVRAGKRRKG